MRLFEYGSRSAEMVSIATRNGLGQSLRAASKDQSRWNKLGPRRVSYLMGYESHG